MVPAARPQRGEEEEGGRKGRVLLLRDIPAGAHHEAVVKWGTTE